MIKIGKLFVQQRSGKTRSICIGTGSRADYGILKPLIREIQGDQRLSLQLVATGMHLAPEFGNTINTIKADQIIVDREIDCLLSGDTLASMAKSVGVGVIGWVDALQSLKPDILVLLGDRFEILAAATASMLMRIPIAHIHGGEVTEGAVDESIRHAITKMSSLHFTAAEVYRQRVIQMGESPEMVWNVGAPGLDTAAQSSWIERSELEKALNFNFRNINALVTYHPETLSAQTPEEGIEELLSAISRFKEFGYIFTMPNADAAGRKIASALKEYVRANADNCLMVASLGEKYFSAIRHMDIIIGNSSSGLIEVPFFKKPTVNIGDRQKGRLRGPSVLDCACNRDEIAKTIQKALLVSENADDYTFLSPYGTAGASVKIKEYLASIDIAKVQTKPFYNLEPKGYR